PTSHTRRIKPYHPRPHQSRPPCASTTIAPHYQPPPGQSPHPAPPTARPRPRPFSGIDAHPAHTPRYAGPPALTSAAKTRGSRPASATGEQAMAHHPTFTALTLMACAGAASAQFPIITDIGVLPGGAVSTSRAISGNGHVVVGSCLLFGANRSISWRHGTQMLDLGLLPGQTSSEAHAANASGAVIVGADRAGSLFRA